MIGTRLKRLRLAKGLTQSELASPKFTTSYVSLIEAGRRQPSQKALDHFAGRLNMSAEELATGRSPALVARLELRLQETRIALSAGRIEEAERDFKAIAKQGRRLELTRLVARAEEGLGLLLERQGKPEESMKHYQRAEDTLRSEPPALSADTVAGKARCFIALGDLRYAIYLLESLLHTIERDKVHDPTALLQLHASLLDAYLEAGMFRRASESAAELDLLAPKVENPLRLAQMHIHVAHLYLTKGSIQEALRSLGRAEDLYRQLNLRTETGHAYLAKGYVYSRDGHLEEARRELEEAMRIFEETGDETDFNKTLNELARVERLAGRTDRAVELLERSISLIGDADAPILAWAHRELGSTLSKSESPRAEKHLLIAIELFERAEETTEIPVTYRALGDLLLHRGDERGALEAYRTGLRGLEPDR